jgi:glutathione S-transferase
MLTLFDYPASPNSRKVRVVLAEKGLPFERRTIDISKGEQHAPEFLAVNPYGKVPALLHEPPNAPRAVIYDSTIINEYLEDAFPEPPLFPRAPADRAHARLLEDWADNLLIEPVGVLFAQYVFTAETRRNKARIEEARLRTVELLRRLGDLLQDGRPYLLHTYSIADAALTPHLAYAEQFGVPFFELLPRVGEWYVRLKNRPSFLA